MKIQKDEVNNMSQDFLAALVRSAEVMHGNDGKKAPVQLHVLSGDEMSPELQELLSSSGIATKVPGGVIGTYIPMEKESKPCEKTEPKKETVQNKEVPQESEQKVSEPEKSSSGTPTILIISHGRQYSSIKKFLAAEGCKDINVFFDVWKNTDDIAKALHTVVGEVYEEVPVRVFNIEFANYKEVCKHFFIAVSDVQLYIDEALSEHTVTREELKDSVVLSRLLSEIVFQLTVKGSK